MFPNFCKITDPTAKAPGTITPRGTARTVCKAIFVIESSGITKINPPATDAETTAPVINVDDDVFNAISANGRSLGESSMAVATRGRTLSLDASSTPMRSNSSAFFNRGIAVDSLNPDFSSRVNNPRFAVYFEI